MPISFSCPMCRHRVKVPDGSGGKRGKCPACGAKLTVPQASEDSSAGLPLADDDEMPDTVAYPPITDGDLAVASHPAPAATAVVKPVVAPPTPTMVFPIPLPVKTQDVEMPFASMVGFMVKWALAAIPAMIILGAIWIGMLIAAALILATIGGFARR